MLSRLQEALNVLHTLQLLLILFQHYQVYPTDKGKDVFTPCMASNIQAEEGARPHIGIPRGNTKIMTHEYSFVLWNAALSQSIDGSAFK